MSASCWLPRSERASHVVTGAAVGAGAVGAGAAAVVAVGVVVAEGEASTAGACLMPSLPLMPTSPSLNFWSRRVFSALGSFPSACSAMRPWISSSRIRTSLRSTSPRSSSSAMYASISSFV